MPELPEVESIRRGLEQRLRGRRVESAELRRADVLRVISPAGTRRQRTRPRHAAVHLLAGDVLDRFERLGKHLAIVGRSGRALEIHLGMSGQLLAFAPGTEPARADHLHARWRFDDGSTLWFRDPRRFGGLWAAETRDELRAARWDRLGPDAITISARALGAGLAGSRRAIKAALLDQRLLAGVGNIYADEALFSAGILPRRSSGSLTPDEVSRLARQVRATLRAAIDAGGSTRRDYVNASGSPGAYQHAHRVYGRSGLPCLRCGQPLRSATIAQRTTAWCERCQR